ncbi:MAG: hypothetical protein J3K34DRAFT_243017 [Monoraphidium minutum]|nr:MAG: hypothetical protein J3K34DRAFT_243017 [Monoraphidium minutum]
MRSLAALALAAAALLAAAAAPAAAQYGMGGGMPPPDLPLAVRSDVPYIKCAVCELFVRQAGRTVKMMREEVKGKPGKHLEEGELMERLEKLCNPRGSEGDWMRRLDMVEEGGAIKLEDMGQIGKPTTETSTIARACAMVSDEVDLADLSEALFLGKTRAQLTQMACYDMTNACKKKPPPLPEDRKDGPEFEAMDPEDAKKEQLMAKLKEAGLGGQMYDRESLGQMGGMGGMGGMGDDMGMGGMGDMGMGGMGGEL